MARNEQARDCFALPSNIEAGSADRHRLYAVPFDRSKREERHRLRLHFHSSHKHKIGELCLFTCVASEYGVLDVVSTFMERNTSVVSSLDIMKPSEAVVEIILSRTVCLSRVAG